MPLAVEITSACVAGLVTVAITGIVERLGPVVGGVLGCVPHVAVVGSVGFILQTDSPEEFRIAMLCMPLGMFCNSVLMVTMRICSWASAWPSEPTARLGFCLTCGTISYAAALAAIMLLLQPKEQSIQVVWLAAATSFVVQLLMGLFLVLCFEQKPKSQTRLRSSCAQLGLRAVLSFGVFFLALAIARSFPDLAGILANLPIVSCMTVIILWLSKDEETTMDCLGPMVLGMLAASAYSMISSELMLLWHPAIGCAVSWFIAVVAITKPTLLVLQRRAHDAHHQKDVEHVSASSESSSCPSSAEESSSC